MLIPTRIIGAEHHNHKHLVSALLLENLWIAFTIRSKKLNPCKRRVEIFTQMPFQLIEI